VRAAFGVFYGSLSGNNWNQPSNFEPFATRLTFTNTGAGKFGTGGRLANPYRGLAGGDPSRIRGPTHLAEEFSALTRVSVALHVSNEFHCATPSDERPQRIVGYVGSLAHNLPFAQDVNYPLITTTPVPSTGNVLQRRPNQGFGQVLLVQSNQTASYHAMQFTVTKRMFASPSAQCVLHVQQELKQLAAGQ